MKVSVDTRTIKRGEYFVPIKGPNFDGNKFVTDALSKGARGIIKEDKFFKIAKDNLNKTKPIIIGIAGSIGKSTFRSYLCSVLRSKYKVLEGDQNTKLGLSLKIINELNKQEIIIAEIGIDRIGEMEKTASFIRPDLAVITKLGKEHLEFFKSFKNVVREESYIFKYTKTKNNYVNSEDVKYYDRVGINKKYLLCFDLPLKSIKVENKINSLLLPDHEKDYLRGIYRIATNYFSLSDEEFILSLEKLSKPKGRLNILKGKNRSIIIDDTYNAVCDQTIIEGIKFALKVAKRENKDLSLVISNMVENGTTVEAQHKKVALFINKLKVNKLCLVGSDLGFYKKYLNIKYKEYLTADLVDIIPDSSSLYYVKATRRYKGPELVSVLTI